MGALRGIAGLNWRRSRKGRGVPAPGWLSHHRLCRDAGAPLCLCYTVAGVRGRSVPAAEMKLQSAD